MTAAPATVAARAIAPADAVAGIPVVATKLYTPRWRAELVSRPRLVDRLAAATERRLTVVTAPAGFGKTTLLAEWLDRRPADAPAGWVQLDASENDPALFWAYVVGALQRLDDDVGSAALALLNAGSSPTVSLLTSLINELAAIDRDFVLVLDDYHVIDAPAVHTGLTFLLDHLPPRLHLVVASRSEPLLPLARLRARGEVLELRAHDLRFTPEEASAFLNEAMSLRLPAVDVAALGERTEGWIAGLKLAALSLQGHADAHAFIEAFSGDHRYIADYLIEEVLASQPERVREFLLGTAILERLSAPLCDAVTGETGSQALLEGLEKSNLFVVALDDRRQWYRYHHLFADVLQKHAATADPDRVRELHARASDWYERTGAHEDAVRHAVAAGDTERVATLLEKTFPAMDRSYQAGRWLARARALPAPLVRARPVLNMHYAWALLNVGELEAAAARLDEVDASLQHDDARLASLPRQVATARVYLAQSRNDVSGTIEHARHALELTAEDDHEARATASALLALAYWATGELEPAHRTFADALAHMRAGGAIAAVIRGTFVLGDIRAAQGRLRDAQRTYESGLRIAEEHRQHGPVETDELYLGLSELHRERGDLDTATSLLHTLEQQFARAEHRGNRARWCTAMARIAEARGDLDDALRLLDEAERHQVRDPLPRVRPVAAMRARCWIARGTLDRAIEWADTHRVRADDEPSYLREFEHVTLARLLIARAQQQHTGDERLLQQAVQLLRRIGAAASAGGRGATVIETLVLEAVALHALGDSRSALDVLARALELAEPEDWLRVLVDEGIPMRDLLRQAVQRGIAGAYPRRLLAAFDAPPPAVAASPAAVAVQPVELLTARELEILRLIAAGLRNQEIADQLFISPATVKRHIANVYNKLEATHRTDALRRAAALNLL